MSFDWHEYLVLARELAGSPTVPSIEEARLRSAISRAYYAAFGRARLHLSAVEGDTGIPATSEAHQQVGDNFAANPDPLHRLIGEHLRTLRLNRNLADYGPSVRGLSGITRASLEMAYWVLQGIDHLPDSPGDQSTNGGVVPPTAP